jgi:xylulokinase
MAGVVVGVDCGTQSTKVICYDPDTKQVLALTQAPYDVISGDDGTRAQKASWWTDALKTCFDQIDPAIKSRITAIGISGQQHGFVPVGGDGEVLYDVKLWCDTSTAGECTEIMDKLGGGAKLLDSNCNLVLPGYTGSKILWFKKNKPELYAHLRHILLPHDYLNFFLTGEYTMEFGDASGTALLNIGTRTWEAGILRAIDDTRDLAETLPRLIQAQEIAGRVTAKAAAFLGIPDGAIVSSGGGDNMMAAIGTGAVAPGVIVASLGTSGTIFGLSETPVIDKKGNLAAFCSSTGKWLPLLCTMNGTGAFNLVRQLLNLSFSEFTALAAAAPAGSQGVTIVPFFNGERTPNYPRGKGSILGLTPDNMTRENLCRAAFESAAYGLKFGLEAFQELGFAPLELRLIGGGSKNPLWRQILADILNLPVVIPEVAEGAAFGAALQALWALKSLGGADVGITEITDAHIQLDPVRTAPNPDNLEAYKQAYIVYQRYVDNFKPIFA